MAPTVAATSALGADPCMPGLGADARECPAGEDSFGRLPCWIHDSRGVELLVRALVPTDEPAVRDLHAQCSPETLRWRYFGVSSQLEHLLTWVFDRAQGQALGVFAHGRLVGLANLMDPDAAGAGEVAFLLADAWQNRGLGSQLVDLVTDLGRDEGARSLHADVTLDNGRMRTLFARRGWTGAIVDGDYCMGLAL
jgi:RimJ/RimL family protein N-acetyltransferase